MGGVLFIDEAYYLYRPENERDYGQEAIEILLQVMENQRDDLVVILAGYADRMERFFSSNPGFRSRIAHHIDFPDYSRWRAVPIAEKMLGAQNYHLDAGARKRCGVHRKRRDAAAFRQCPLDPQRARPGAAAAGQPPVRGVSGARLDAEALVHDLGGAIIRRAGCSDAGNKAADGRKGRTMTGQTIIAPSILSADFSRLGDEVEASSRPAPTGSIST